MLAVLLLLAPVWTLVLFVEPLVAVVGGMAHGTLILMAMGEKE